MPASTPEAGIAAGIMIESCSHIGSLDLAVSLTLHTVMHLPGAAHAMHLAGESGTFKE